MQGGPGQYNRQDNRRYNRQDNSQNKWLRGHQRVAPSLLIASAVAIG